MDESILVCVNNGPNGEALICRGGKLAQMLNCPLYVLMIDPNSEEELDIEKSHYLALWKELAVKYDADAFIILHNEKRPVAKIISEVARKNNITQLVLGQTAQSRWREITKGSILNVLLHEIPYVDLHIVSVARDMEEQNDFFEKGLRAYLVLDCDRYKLSFNHTCDIAQEGIFFKEVGTDFNNGVFKYIRMNEVIEVHITEDYVVEDVLVLK